MPEGNILAVLNGPGTAHLKSKWVIQIKPNDEANNYLGADTQVIWATEELEKWEGVKRRSWNMWSFPTKHDAEKFQTLYCLKWLT